MTRVITEGFTPQNIFFRRYLLKEESVPLVLVMGYGGSLDAWTHFFVEQLSKHQEVIIFDNRGTGHSYRPESISDFSISHFVSDLKGLLDHLSLSKVNLLGYSLGGSIALQFSHENAKRVNRLIIMSATAGGALYSSPGEEILNSLLNPEGSSQKEMFLSTFSLCLPKTNMQKYERELSEIFELSCENLPSKLTLSGQLKAYQEFDAQPFLAEILNPVKIIHGKNDRLTPVSNAIKLAEHIGTAELIILNDCEHCPHIEQPSRLIEEICSPVQTIF